MQHSLRKCQFWVLNQAAFYIWDQTYPKYGGIHSSTKSKGVFSKYANWEHKALSGILSWVWVHRIFQTQKQPLTTDNACSLPPAQHQSSLSDWILTSQEKTRSQVQSVKYYYYKLWFGLNLWFGTRCHIFPAHLLSSINKNFIASSWRPLLPISTEDMALKQKININNIKINCI